jgi:hypothetical protein
MSEDVTKLKALRKLKREVFWEELWRSFYKGLLKWLGYSITLPITIFVLTLFAKLCYYVALWAWHLF